ncbi:uncharacterized protein SPSK_10652 [Sporothrix schenckii 1099-18]|uniref:Uncharacterized protein n=1 Tax=Sporothrix schenckii 1099-18 TaxID=1397361 RepID=A0A0F2LV26_SPOSC|nr:uncharacterized protein SPSK_10652 [Sporothrix schenckii 1099-18]KJR80355.1 hypothetical protein SPSK_10652 [Sporothrix schenckii 1099-18]
MANKIESKMRVERADGKGIEDADADANAGRCEKGVGGGGWMEQGRQKREGLAKKRKGLGYDWRQERKAGGAVVQEEGTNWNIEPCTTPHFGGARPGAGVR